MRRSLLQLACIGAFGALATSALAQQYGSPGATSRPSESTVTPTTKAAPNPNAARDAAAVEYCNQFRGAVRIDCLARERGDAEHVVNAMPAGTAAAGAPRYGGFTGPSPSAKNN
jgi:hypothetical protein